MEYTAIQHMLEYWKEPDPEHFTDEWRRTHDLDCILADGNLRADMLFSLWLPLRYTLNRFDCPQWVLWKERASKSELKLKRCPEFLDDLGRNIGTYLPDGEDGLARSLERLFELGQTRANVIVLHERSWNRARGGWPYYDYMPHFLYDLLNEKPMRESATSLAVAKNWIRDQHMSMFFEGNEITAGALRDLAGTGSPQKHNPRNIDVALLLNNYCNILEERSRFVPPDGACSR